MTEKISNFDYKYYDSEQDSDSMNDSEFDRQQFELEMVDKGLISSEFYESGVLKKFELNPENGHDSLKHILIGSERGGLHHLPTQIEVGNVKTKVASSIASNKPNSKKISKYKAIQKKDENGVYRAGDIVISSNKNKRFIKRRGSNMFPDEWSTQEVLEAILLVSNEPISDNGDENNSRSIHKAQVNGVNIEVITSNSSGNILTAFPI